MGRIYFVDTLMNSHELGRVFLYTLITNTNEILRLASFGIVEFLGSDEMTELVLIIHDLVLDVKRTEKNVHAHIVRTKGEFELESLEDSVR